MLSLISSPTFKGAHRRNVPCADLPTLAAPGTVVGSHRLPDPHWDADLIPAREIPARDREAFLL